ncbi:MAG: biotin/lipoyl-binding protein [Bacteroidales bacterium]|nr:biotin/lipoyl-binding protein [Bacteroidales bacterium]
MKTFKFKINGKDYAVDIKDVDGQEMRVAVNGTDYHVLVEQELRKHSTISERPKPHVTAAANVVQRFNPAAATKEATVPSPHEAKVAASGNSITAPLPGTILDVFVNVGDTVKEGQSVLLLEAMKMENHIEADAAGTVKEIRVRKGDSVLEGDVLIVIG